MKTPSKYCLVIGIFSAMAVTAFADFINGGFEDGNFTGWTKGGGTWNPGGVTSTVDPNKSAIISNPTATDPNTMGLLYEVLQGSDSVRVNNSDNGYHFSTLTQTVANYTDPNMYLGFAAVLENPDNGHTEDQTPKFSFSIVDETKGLTLYSTAFNSLNASSHGVTWNTGLRNNANNSTWMYTDWNIIHIDTSQYLGDTFTVSVSAYDCALGAHGGYAYVDDFQPTLPSPNAGIPYHLIEAASLRTPEPTSVGLWGLGGLILWGCGKLRKSRPAA